MMPSAFLLSGFVFKMISELTLYVLTLPCSHGVVSNHRLPRHHLAIEAAVHLRLEITEFMLTISASLSHFPAL